MKMLLWTILLSLGVCSRYASAMIILGGFGHENAMIVNGIITPNQQDCDTLRVSVITYDNVVQLLKSYINAGDFERFQNVQQVLPRFRYRTIKYLTAVTDRKERLLGIAHTLFQEQIWYYFKHMVADAKKVAKQRLLSAEKEREKKENDLCRRGFPFRLVSYGSQYVTRLCLKERLAAIQSATDDFCPMEHKTLLFIDSIKISDVVSSLLEAIMKKCEEDSYATVYDCYSHDGDANPTTAFFRGPVNGIIEKEKRTVGQIKTMLAEQQPAFDIRSLKYLDKADY